MAVLWTPYGQVDVELLDFPLNTELEVGQALFILLSGSWFDEHSFHFQGPMFPSVRTDF